jgi:muramoyltetrapeptide carboxypeptidase
LALIEEYLKPLGVPVVAGYPAGHDQYNLTLPMGGLMELDANALQVNSVENCIVAN